MDSSVHLNMFIPTEISLSVRYKYQIEINLILSGVGQFKTLPTHFRMSLSLKGRLEDNKMLLFGSLHLYLTALSFILAVLVLIQK